MRRNFVLFIFVICILVAPVSPSFVDAKGDKENIQVSRGGVNIILDGGERMYYESYNRLPFIYKGTTYLPVRAIAEALGKQVRLDGKTSTLYLYGSKDDENKEGAISFSYKTQETITMNRLTLSVEADGKPANGQVEAILYDNAAFLPMRTLAGLVGAEVEWDPVHSNIYLYKPIANVQTLRIKTDASIRNVVDRGSGFLSSYSDLAPSIVTFVNPDGTLHVGWEEEGEPGLLRLETLDVDLKRKSVIAIPKEMPLFGTFTKDGEGNFYVLWGQKMDEGDKAGDSVKISKYSSGGVKLGEVLYQAGVQYFKGTKEPFAFANAKLRYHNGLVVAFFGRLMFQSTDGLNHQSSTALYADAATMKEVSLPIPYVSHSFDQDLTFDGDNIVFVDRGDVYDRGFAITKVNRSTRQKHTITPFYFKMGEAIYQKTFSELGGIAAADNGYVLVGSSERTMSAQAAKENHNESRNLFLQMIGKNFEALQQPILSKGDIQQFEISLMGNTYQAANNGVVWLTDYRDKALENAAHPKVTPINGNEFLILWEKMGAAGDRSMAYRTTYYMVVTAEGKVIKPAAEIKGARLNSGDSVIYQNGAAYWAVNNEQGVVVYKFNPQT